MRSETLALLNLLHSSPPMIWFNERESGDPCAISNLSPAKEPEETVGLGSNLAIARTDYYLKKEVGEKKRRIGELLGGGGRGGIFCSFVYRDKWIFINEVNVSPKLSFF